MELPIKVRIDNVGAMFMSENVTSTPRTRHVGAKHWWITDLQDDGLIKVEFVSTKDNTSDIGAKNVSGDVLDKHLPMLQCYREPRSNKMITTW